MSQNLKRNFMKKIFQKIVPPKNQVLEEFDKNIFKYSHRKEQKILSKMSGRPTLYDVSLQSYKREKNSKNCIIYQKTAKSRLKTYFFEFF